MLYSFDSYVLDINRRELRRGVERVELEPQVFDLLAFLIRARDRVASRDDLLDAVWNGRIVSESTLSSRINAARTAIGDDGTAQRLIRTLPRKGFRFVGDVSEQDVLPTPEPAAQVAPVAGGIRPGNTGPDGPSIAVLPFTNMSDDPESDHIADGIAEDIITALWRYGGLTVIARNSSFAYKGRAVDIREIGRELGADYVLEGSVRRYQASLRITAQLIESASGTHLWADRFDVGPTDVFEVQDRITERAVAIIEPTLRFAEAERARRGQPQYVTAYDLRMRALSLANEFTDESMAAAMRCLAQALEIDPSYAIAMAASAFYEAQRHLQGWTQESGEARTKAARLAWGAVKIAKDDPIVLWMAGFSVWILERDAPRSRDLFRRSLLINPNSPIALSLAGLVESTNGNPTEGRKLIERSRRLNPRPPREWFNLAAMAITCVAEGKFEEAIAQAESALVQNRRFSLALSALAVSRVEIGDIDRAKQVVQQHLAIDRRLSVAVLPGRLPPFDAQLLRTYIAAIRQAGLPE
jgi:TolB-like protein